MAKSTGRSSKQNKTKKHDRNDPVDRNDLVYINHSFKLLCIYMVYGVSNAGWHKHSIIRSSVQLLL